MKQSGLAIEKITSVWVVMNVGSLLCMHHCCWMNITWLLKSGLSGMKKRMLSLIVASAFFERHMCLV